MSELKPCPFCGCKMNFDRASSGWNKITGMHKGICPLDGNDFITWSSNEDAPIIQKFNTRVDGFFGVEEFLPEIGQECLIEIPVCDKFNLESAKYKGEGVWVGAWCDSRGKGCNYKVTRWMPSPISSKVTK